MPIFQITILDKYLGKRLAAYFLRTAAAFLLLFIVVDLLTHRRIEILKHDVPWSIVLQYYACLTPAVLVEFQMAALAMLVATLFVFGTAAHNNELTAVLAAGIGIRRLSRVPVALGLLLTVALFCLTETVGVAASRKTQDIEQRYLARNPNSIRTGVSWAHLPEDWRCHIMKFNRIALTGESVLMLSERPDAIQQIQADRIYWDETTNTWMLEDGLWSIFDPEQGMIGEHRRITQVAAPITETPEELLATTDYPASRTLAQLLGAIRYAEERGMPSTRLRVDFHGKFAKPFLCLVTVVLAIPFAVRLRAGGLAVGVGAALVVALAYLGLFAVTQGLGYMGYISPLASAWTANLLFLCVGGALFARTPT